MFSRFPLLITFLSLLLPTLAQANDYKLGLEKARKEAKVLWLVVSEKPFSFPDSKSLQSKIDADVLVQVKPQDAVADGKTFSEVLKLSAEETDKGVLLLYGFHEPLLDNHGQRSGTLQNLNKRWSNEIEDFYNKSVFRLTVDEKKMMVETNRYRKLSNKPALKVSRFMTETARAFTKDPAACANPGNVHSIARTLLMNRGYKGQATENCAQGQSDGTDAIVGWETSPIGHSKQLLGLISVNSQWIDGGFLYAGPSIAYGVSNQGFTGSSSIIYLGTTAK